MNRKDDPSTTMKSPDQRLGELDDVHAHLELAEFEVTALPPTQTSHRLRQILTGVRWTLGSWDSAQASRQRKISRLRRVIAEVRAEARRHCFLDPLPADLVARVSRPGSASGAAGARERRRETRAPVRAPVTFTPWDPLRTWIGMATNLSMGGAFVSTSYALARGSSIALRVRAPAREEAVLAGVVQRSDVDGIAVRFLGGGVGLQDIRAIMVAGRGMPLRPWFVRR